MIASPTPGTAYPENSSENIPVSLVCEIIDGKPYYYKGFRDVLSGDKTIEDIMGCSPLQSIVIECILGALFEGIDRRKYFIATNEPGVYLNDRTTLAGDILIFERSSVPITNQYARVPPKIWIEVDLNIEFEKALDVKNYMALKTQKILDFGTDKVIWILTKPKKVVIAANDHTQHTIPWDVEIEIFGGASYNIGRYVDENEPKFFQ
ncbi:MAG: Uma2 family endonuclease [Dyadobacter sp.]|uniref:Uma2 family endonuclease n=1 Tax=Dyadobacter sp. TaxID=1914288 RepID=UPI001B0E0949|nr:Uma2 family endonuclease [Dyadobacter sp.]MBO9614252.1 Uma2 family endonuclease [Dyadobacter sp.]